MSAVGDVTERTERPAYVRFKRVAVEDKAESLKQQKYVAKDVDYALITPPYSKDVVEMKVSTWMTNLDSAVQNERMPKAWADAYRASYAAFLKGQDLPLNGTPIRAWGVISPAQQEMLTRIGILTVEDLGAANDEGMRRIGMGAVELRSKAKAWLSQLQDKGPLTIKMAAIETENQLLKESLETLQKQFDALKTLLPASPVMAAPFNDSITANDILPENEPQERPKRK